MSDQKYETLALDNCLQYSATLHILKKESNNCFCKTSNNMLCLLWMNCYDKMYIVIDDIVLHIYL